MSSWFSTTRITIGSLFLVVLILVLVVIQMVKTSALQVIWQAEFEDPLFDFPGLSSEEWPEAIAIIKTANQQLLGKVHPRFASYHLYPYRFWEKAANVAKKRDLFLSEPTWLDAFKLLNAQSRALEAYAGDLASFRQLWSMSVQESASLVKPETIFPFLPGAATDIPTMNAALALMTKNALSLQKDISQRRDCLLFGLCEKLAGTLRYASDAGLTADPSAVLLPSPLLSPEVISRSKKYLNAATLADRLFMIKTECFGQANEPSAFLLWQRRYEDDTLAFFPKLATDLFFRTLSGDVHLPQDELLRQEKFEYSWQPETNWYMCSDLAYYPILATMYDLMEKGEKEPLAVSFPNLKEVEERLKQSSVVEPPLIADYIAALQALKNESEEVYYRLRLWETKSGRLIDVIRGLKPEIVRYIGMANAVGAPAAPIFTVLSHSHISLFYAPWNPSVWRLKEEPRFILSDSRERPFIRNYWSLSSELGSYKIQRIQELSILGSSRLFVDK